MTYAATSRKKRYAPILATAAVLVICALPYPTFSAQSIATIQLGSYLTEQGATKHYTSLQKKLKPQDWNSIRIEKVGKYYALRLGLFDSSAEETEKTFRKVKAVNPDAILLNVTLEERKPDRTVAAEPTAAIPETLVATVVALRPETRTDVKKALSTPEPGLPAKGREPAEKKIQPVHLTLQKVHALTADMIQESQPLIPDGLLIGFTTMIALFMLEQYLRALVRLGRLESFKWLFSKATAAEFITERPLGAVSIMAAERQFDFALSEITADRYFTDHNPPLAEGSQQKLSEENVQNQACEGGFQPIEMDGPTDPQNGVWLAEYGAFDLDEGRFCSDDEFLAVAEESSEIIATASERRNVHQVFPSTNARSYQSGRGTAKKIDSAEKADRENRVARAVLAVSFFAEEEWRDSIKADAIEPNRATI